MIDGNKYVFRPATIKDIDFLVETVIQAEKSSTGMCGLANYFSVSEEEMRGYVKQMFAEEVDGCELSVSSFIVVEYEGKVVAASGGWLEGNNEDGLPSSILKSNLLMYVLPKDIILDAQKNADVIKDLTEAHIARAKSYGPQVKKIQAHAFEANKVILLINKVLRFKQTKRFVSTHPRILEFYPDKTILLMEKIIN